MPYIPDLVPDENKVLPDYFQKQSVAKNLKKQNPSNGSVLLFILFIALAICFIRYGGFAAMMTALALTCTGGGKRWLEKKGKFSFTGTAKTIILAAGLLISIPIYLGYLHQDETDAANKIAAHERAEKFTADSITEDKTRQTQLFKLINTAKRLAPDTGLRMLSRTTSLVKTNNEKDSIRSVYEKLKLIIIQRSLVKKDYQTSLNEIKSLLEINHQNPELLFYRARANLGLNQTQQAVNDLASAKAMGYKPAARLYEKVNPLKKRITGYCTLCADGTTSYATGRGACSWHGGVAEWNHPIYELFRKYGE